MSQGINAQFLVTHHGQFKTALNIRKYYGAQKSRQTAEEINQDWQDAVKKMIKIEANPENAILMGNIGNSIFKT